MGCRQPSETEIWAEPEDYDRRRQWWESLRSWFAERGYILNKTVLTATLVGARYVGQLVP